MQKFYVLLLLILPALILPACDSSRKAVRSGNYDKAITKTVRKLRRNPNHEKSASTLEEAFAKVTQRDMERINFLKKEGRPEIWVEVFEIYSQIQRRQQLISPLLPLKKGGATAVFNFINYDAEVIAAKQKAAEYLYAHSMELLKKNDRGAAREAYAELLKVRTYYPSFKDVNQQLARARDLGTNKVLFKMVNATGVPLPPDFERDLTKMSLQELNREWIEYHVKEIKGVFYDYHLVVNMRVIDVGPESVKEVHYKEEKKVEDGWEYKLDSKGNVVKDSLGNDIKIPKYKNLVCFVTEVQQTKVARISGTVDYLDKRNGQLIRSFPITSDGVFEHFAATANGELDALKPETRAKLSNKPMPFPPDFELLLLAGRTLQPMVKDIIWNNTGLVTY